MHSPSKAIGSHAGGFHHDHFDGSQVETSGENREKIGIREVRSKDKIPAGEILCGIRGGKNNQRARLDGLPDRGIREEEFSTEIRTHV